MHNAVIALYRAVRKPFAGRRTQHQDPLDLDIRSLFFDDLSVGMTESLSHTVLPASVAEFAELTGDRNPIHLSDDYAAQTQFQTRIAHGLFTASLISAVLGTRLPGPGAIYISQSLNFRAPVHLGDTVEVAVAVAELVPERRRARLACACKVRGDIVLDGEAWVKVPARPELALVANGGRTHRSGEALRETA